LTLNMGHSVAGLCRGERLHGCISAWLKCIMVEKAGFSPWLNVQSSNQFAQIVLRRSRTRKISRLVDPKPGAILSQAVKIVVAAEAVIVKQKVKSDWLLEKKR
jgi:hypothetical protein